MTAEVRITFEAAKGFVDIESMSEQMKLRLEGTTAEHWGKGWLEWSADKVACAAGVHPCG